MTTTAPRRQRVPLRATVTGREQLTPMMVRLTLAVPGFTPSDQADSYVKLVFTGSPETPETLDLDALPERPRLRTYTVRGYDAASSELTLDLVTHGDHGLAGTWAQAAGVGDAIFLLGPGGGYTPDPAASHLLVGDESALPAIAVALERLDPGARAEVFVEVGAESDELPLPTAADAQVRWVHRGAAAPGQLLVEAVTSAEVELSGVHAFVHGEAGMVKTLRAWLRDAGVPRESVSISGYWRVGVDDEGWRAIKRGFDTD